MYKSLEDLERVISLGKPEKVIDLFLESYLQGEEKKAWLKVQEAEHKTLYPETIPNPDYVAEVPAVGDEWIDNLDGTFTANPDYIPAVPAIGDETIPNPDFIGFDEWMQETVVTQVAQDAVYDENNILITPAVAEVTELAREFTEVDVSAKAVTWKETNAVYKGLIDTKKQIQLDRVIVTTSTGKQFYGDPISRVDISDAIGIAKDNGLTTTTWKLATGIEQVTLAELQEARLLSLQAKGAIIGV